MEKLKDFMVRSDTKIFNFSTFITSLDSNIKFLSGNIKKIPYQKYPFTIEIPNKNSQICNYKLAEFDDENFYILTKVIKGRDRSNRVIKKFINAILEVNMIIFSVKYLMNNILGMLENV